jgi:hypothetical protein
MILSAVHKQTGEKIYGVELELRMDKEYTLVRDTGLLDINGVPILDGDIVAYDHCGTEMEITYRDGSFWAGTDRLTGFRITECRLTVLRHSAVETVCVFEPGKFYTNRYIKVHALCYVTPIKSASGMLCETSTHGTLEVIKDNDYRLFKEITEEEFICK